MDEDEIDQRGDRGAADKGTGRNRGEFFALRHFRHLAHDEFEAVLDHHEIGPRLIRLAQGQVVFRGRLNQLGPRLQSDGTNNSCPAPPFRALRQRPQYSPGAWAQPAMGLFLNSVGDPADQQVTAQPGRRCGAVQPAPLDPEIGGRQPFEGNQPGVGIRPFRPPFGCRIQGAGRPAGCTAGLLVLGERHLPAAAMR